MMGKEGKSLGLTVLLCCLLRQQQVLHHLLIHPLGRRRAGQNADALQMHFACADSRAAAAAWCGTVPVAKK